MLKKLFLGLCGLFAIVVIASMLFGARLLDRGLHRGITTYGPRLTQTTVELGAVNVSPLSGTGTIHGLVVGNPEGFSENQAIRLEEASITLDVRSVLGDAITIEHIRIHQPMIHLERAQGTTNLQRIQDNINRAVGPEDARPSPENDRAGRKFIVEEFVLEGGRVSLSALGSQTEVAMPPVRLQDIGKSEGGVTGDEVGRAILDAVLRSALAAAGREATNLLNDPQRAEESLRGAADQIQRLFNREREGQ